MKAVICTNYGSPDVLKLGEVEDLGADVTGVCSNGNLELVKSLGADMVIDYTNEDFIEREETYDLIFDAVDKLPPAKRKKSLRPKGYYLNVIDRTYSLEQTAEAHEYVELGHKKVSVVINIINN